MNIADTAVHDFGRTMGMAGLAFNDAGVLRLRFERSGVLSIERTPGGAMLRLARPVGHDATLRRALELCHFEAVDQMRPDAGLARDGSLVFSLRIDERDVNLP